MRKLALALAVFVVFVLSAFGLPACPPPNIVAQVVRVIDGDTIEVKIISVPDEYAGMLKEAEKIRYIGVDAPELSEPNGVKAAVLNALLVEGRTVYLELDSTIRDDYGRLLAYVYLDEYGELMVNLILITTSAIGTKTYSGTTRYAEVFEYVDSRPIPCRTQVIISAILPNPRGTEPDEEWIELKNVGSSPVDISGWLITDGEGRYTIPQGTVLSPGKTWRVYGRQYNPTAIKTGLYLANAGDCVLLYDRNGVLVDRCCWTSDPGADRVVVCH